MNPIKPAKEIQVGDYVLVPAQYFANPKHQSFYMTVKEVFQIGNTYIFRFIGGECTKGLTPNDRFEALEDNRNYIDRANPASYQQGFRYKGLNID